jgi:hypothetical protein
VDGRRGAGEIEEGSFVAALLWMTVARRHFAARLRLVAACWRGRKSKAWTITTEDAEKGRRTRRVGDDAEIGHGGDSKLKTTAAQLKLAAQVLVAAVLRGGV